MKVVDSEFLLTIPQSKGRSKGLHQSDVVRAIALDMGWLKPEYATAELDPNKICLGLAWEEWVGPQHPEVAMHPGESTREGITVTVDGISYQDIPILNTKGKTILTMEMPVVHEVKCTWYSMPDDPEELIEDTKWWMYRAQMMNGCMIWNTRFAKLHPFFINGDYGWMRGKKDATGAIYKVYEFEFEQWEINENWTMITNYVRNHRDKFPQLEQKK